MSLSVIDHLVVGVNELNRGIAWIEKPTGVCAAYGGVHPGRGTRNALLSLGPRCYLEILAPDPAQKNLSWFPNLPDLSEPRLVGWMAHPPGLAGIAEGLRWTGLSFDGPREYSRQRPDGHRLRWKLLRLSNDLGGVLPILIEWNPDSTHPADDAPAGCRLLHFELGSPDPEQAQKILGVLGITLPVSLADRPSLRAGIAGPKGTLELIPVDT